MTNSNRPPDVVPNVQVPIKLYSDYVRQSKYIRPLFEPYFPKIRGDQDLVLSLIGGLLSVVVFSVVN